MRILLTGGAGFIGSHTAVSLLERGDHVTVVDNVNPYYDTSIKEEALQILKDTALVSGKLSIVKADITKLSELEPLFSSEEKPDVVIHLAAQAGVRYSIEHAPSNIMTNILGTVNLLELCRMYNVTRVVAASSSSVYGKDTQPPFKENMMASQPISPYAATKRSCELLGFTYHHLYGLSVVMLRFFTVYGPRGRPDMAVFKFIDRISRGVPIDKYGDGSAVREFTYISDIVDGVIASVDHVTPEDESKPIYDIVNLGGGSTHTLNELIECVESSLGLAAQINPLPNQPGDVPITSADQERAKEVLGFSPKVSLKEGIERTVSWYREWKVKKAERCEGKEATSSNLKGEEPSSVETRDLGVKA